MTAEFMIERDELDMNDPFTRAIAGFPTTSAVGRAEKSKHRSVARLG